MGTNWLLESFAMKQLSVADLCPLPLQALAAKHLDQSSAHLNEFARSEQDACKLAVT